MIHILHGIAALGVPAALTSSCQMGNASTSTAIELAQLGDT